MQTTAVSDEFEQHTFHGLGPHIHKWALLRRQQVTLGIADENDHRFTHRHRFKSEVTVEADQALIEDNVRPAVDFEGHAIRDAFNKIELNWHAAVLQSLHG